VVSERGQATIEWTGLALVAALLLGALTTLAPLVDDRGLGATVAHAITCAARGGCAGEAARGTAAIGVGPVRSDVAAGAEARPAPPARPPVTADRAAAPLQALRGVRDVAKRVWIVCMGYRRYLDERAHPRIGPEAMPLAEALDIANECLNPLGFVSDG
jgi:hypothetical protein